MNAAEIKGRYLTPEGLIMENGNVIILPRGISRQTYNQQLWFAAETVVLTKIGIIDYVIRREDEYYEECEYDDKE